VFFSYAIVTPDRVDLFINDEKLTPEVKAHLDEDVVIKPYELIFADVKALGTPVSTTNGEGASTQPSKFLLSNKASWALSLSLGGQNQLEEVRSPIADAKAIKNETELEGMRACHIRDGAALAEFFAWLENELVCKRSKLNELEAADKLEQIRSRNQNFVGLSFDTISSTGPNAAIIHYKPEEGKCAVIDSDAIYLCDSGAQYLDGTTDTTRTFHFGKPSEMERKAFTLVLKGAIALETAVFPKGTSGFALDAFARQFLWKEGLDYLHGTGHGVGSYLVRVFGRSRHVLDLFLTGFRTSMKALSGLGPAFSILKWPSLLEMSSPMVCQSRGSLDNCHHSRLSWMIEPGYYEDGKFGIRIESGSLCRNSFFSICRGLTPLFRCDHGPRGWNNP
jgi:Xaa-Pro aminopeptidase